MSEQSGVEGGYQGVIQACRSCPCFSPIDYTCNCGRPAHVVVSAEPENPFRRFARCTFFPAPYMCDYFRWVDGPLCDRVRPLATSLLLRKEALSAQVSRQTKKCEKLRNKYTETMGRFIEAEADARGLRKAKRRVWFLVWGLMSVIVLLVGVICAMMKKT